MVVHSSNLGVYLTVAEFVIIRGNIDTNFAELASWWLILLCFLGWGLFEGAYSKF